MDALRTDRQKTGDEQGGYISKLENELATRISEISSLKRALVELREQLHGNRMASESMSEEIDNLRAKTAKLKTQRDKLRKSFSKSQLLLRQTMRQMRSLVGGTGNVSGKINN